MRAFPSVLVLTVALARTSAAQEPPGAHGYGMSPVGNLVITATDTVTVDLSWIAKNVTPFWALPPYPNNGPATRYEILYATTSGVSTVDKAVALISFPLPGAEGTPQSGTILGLTQGTHYYFTFRTHLTSAFDGADCVRDNPEFQVTTHTDALPPAVISDLALEDLGGGDCRLTWTSSGDDGSTGTAYWVDLRHSVAGAIVTTNDFGSAEGVAGVPAPAAAGTSQFVTLTGLAKGRTHYFAIRAVDEVGNLGPISVPGASLYVEAPPSEPGSTSQSHCGGSAMGLSAGVLGLLAAALLVRRQAA